MTLEKLTLLANNFADEQYTEEMTSGFVNEAIAKINSALDVDLPFFLYNGDSNYSDAFDYTYLSETWQYMLFVPYIHYSIKINDGSVNEASYALLQRFDDALKQLKRRRGSDITKKYRLRWVPATKLDYDNAVIIDRSVDYIVESGNDFTTDNNDDFKLGGDYAPFDNVVLRVTFSMIPDYYQYFRLTDNSGIAKMPRIGSNNVGWF